MRLDLPAYALLILCVAAIASGQILFKIAAISETGPSFIDKMLHPAFLAGMVVYVLTTLLWLWLLQTIPLQIAYPFMALSFVFVPLLAFFFFEEGYSIRVIIGGIVIIAGVIIASK